jgi:carboxymethylenebutenolidase
VRLVTALVLLGFVMATAAAPVPYAPTAPDAVPAAILGKGEKPLGSAVAYFPADPKARGYLAVPAGEGPHGAVILIHEWDGLGQRVRQVADALAAEGYVALAADLYSGRTGGNPEQNMALVKETLAQPQRLIANLDAAVAFLRARKDVSGKVATIGWCYGGGVALSYALGGVNHEGTAMFYGRLLDDPEKLKHLHHELYGTFAGLDHNIKPEDVEHFVGALRIAGIKNDVHVYDDVDHGFWLYVDRDPKANLTPALDAWQRLKAYLARTLQ